MTDPHRPGVSKQGEKGGEGGAFRKQQLFPPSPPHHPLEFHPNRLEEKKTVKITTAAFGKRKCPFRHLIKKSDEAFFFKKNYYRKKGQSESSPPTLTAVQAKDPRQKKRKGKRKAFHFSDFTFLPPHFCPRPSYQDSFFFCVCPRGVNKIEGGI